MESKYTYSTGYSEEDTYQREKMDSKYTFSTRDSADETEFSAPFSLDKPSWWQFDLTESPSDELEAASFAIRPSPTREERNNHGSDFLSDQQRAAHEKKHKHSHRGSRRQGRSPFWEEGSRTTTILDILEKNVCNFDYIDTHTLRQIEDRLRLSKLEEQLEKMHNRTWKIWHDLNEDDSASYESSDSNSMPPSPVSSELINSFDNTADIMGDLEVDLDDVRQRKAAARKNAMENKKDAEKTTPLSPYNRKTAKGEEPKTQKSETKTAKRSKEQKKKKTKENDEKDDKTEGNKGNKSNEDGASMNTVLSEPDDKDIPMVVDASAPLSRQEEMIMDVMSALTDDGNPFPYSLAPKQGHKTCVPLFFQKRLEMLKVRMSKTSSTPTTKSGDSAPLMRLVAHSNSEQSTVEVNTTLYIYDYESKTHEYVAYFRRGLAASQSLNLYQHPTPPSFNTMKSEVVVKISASTVSPTDNTIRKGEWWGESSPNALNLPIVPGTAFTGKVEEIDKSILSKSGLKKGDRVVSLVRVGANSRHLCIDHERLVKVPADMSDSLMVACLPEVYLAAFQALHYGKKNGSRYRKTSLSNKSILILAGGTGPMGRALIEIARAAGARSVYATGRDKEFDLIEKIGGLALSRDPKHWLSAMAAKIDIIVSVDAPYAKTELKYSHIQTLTPDGKLVVIGAPDQSDRVTLKLDAFDVRDTETKRKMHNYNVFDAWEADMKQGKKDLAHLLKLFKDGLVKPQLLERVPLPKIAKAHDYFETKKVTGFVLCEPWIIGTKQQPPPNLPPSTPSLLPPIETPYDANAEFEEPPHHLPIKTGEPPVPESLNLQNMAHRTPSNMPLRGGTCGTPVLDNQQGSYVSFSFERPKGQGQARKRVLV